MSSNCCCGSQNLVSSNQGVFQEFTHWLLRNLCLYLFVCVKIQIYTLESPWTRTGCVWLWKWEHWHVIIPWCREIYQDSSRRRSVCLNKTKSLHMCWMGLRRHAKARNLCIAVTSTVTVLLACCNWHLNLK